MRVLSAFLLSVQCVLAQEPSVFQAGVSLVRLDAQVVAADGRIVEGLFQKDFRVFDNRQEQKIVHFSTAEENLDLILLFDISTSMRPAVEAVARAAREGLHELRKGDRVAIMQFNTRTSLTAPFTEDLEAVERSISNFISSTRFRGGTWIQSAAENAAKAFRGEPRTQRRRAVLIITDNVGIRTRNEMTVVRNYWEVDALLSGLIVRNAGTQAIRAVTTVIGPQNLLLQAGMKGIAEKTGGDAFTAHDPGTGFRDAMRRIRSRYSLYYASPVAKAGETRSVRLELSLGAAKLYPKARVRARTGYVAR